MSKDWIDFAYPLIDDQGNFISAENFRKRVHLSMMLHKYKVNIRGRAPQTIMVTEKQHKLSREDAQAYLSMVANALSISKTLIEGIVYLGKAMKK